MLLLVAGAAPGCQWLGPPDEAPLLVQAAPVYVEPAPVVFDAPMAGVPGYPEPLVGVPAPAFAPPALGDASGAIAPQFGLPAAEVAMAGLANPLKVPVSNHDFAWDQIADVVSEYFPISREQRVQIDQQIWTEGRIETPYQVAATMFEPHRKDTVGSFNRWQSTLQTVRRRALVRVVPEPDGYLVDLRVDRELEDLPRPEQASAGDASLRNDNSLPSAAYNEVSRTRWSPVWIPLGRDTPLEQKMLGEIKERLAVTPHVPMTITPVQ